MAGQQGWQVVSLDFSDVAQRKASDLAARRGVVLDLVQADVHTWNYPPEAFDLVADIFSQFSTPDDRARKWASMARSLRTGGHLILQGYTPDQLRHGTGGPNDVARLYTEGLLRRAFAEFEILNLEEIAAVLEEGPGHSGPSAVIGMVARRSA